ncbi:hypothetical protein [Isorropodon fossajaponicum symbiont]|uniref:hypothetical protein n=1 Tax=Isorropodon fossajaponicum symbiont TaxID=883811 RepID=UPI001914E976|nr:hypothetical protein [Isorropodon fossajaponicum symbiont]
MLNWHINSKQDKFNNTINYQYITHQNVSYIDNITYNHNQIKFNYTSRPDIATSYQFGQTQIHNKLLKAIQIKHSSNLVKTYQMYYDTYVGHSRLDNIKLYDSQDECTKPLSFVYQHNDLITDDEPVFEQAVIKLDEVFNYSVADFNHDG